MREFCRSLVVLSLLWLVACAGTPQDKQAVAARPAAQKVLRVGLSPDYPPLAWQEEGQIRGFEVDMANEVASHLGMKVQLVPVHAPQLIPALLRGDIDVIMSGMAITPEREARVAFSDSYMQIGQMAIIRVRDAGRFRTPAQVLESGAMVGFIENTSGATFVNGTQGIRRKHGYVRVQEALEALQRGEIDVFIHDAPTSWDIAVSSWADTLMSLYRPLTRESLAWAVRPDDKALLEGMNRTLKELRDSGKLEMLMYRWIPVQVQLEE